MENEAVENIALKGHKPRGVYTPAKKIDCGPFYMVFVSGIQPPKDENHQTISTDIKSQTRAVFTEISEIMVAAGGSLDDVVKAVIYVTDIDDFAQISSVRDEYFANSKPASSLVEVNAMSRAGAKIEIEVTAIIRK